MLSTERTHLTISTAEILDILAALFLQFPTMDHVKALNDVIPLLTERLEIANPPLLQASDTAVREYLQDVYDMFLVPVSGHYLPPYESAQRAGRLQGPITWQVHQIYKETGFDIHSLHVDPVWRTQHMPDHIGYELAFLSALLQVHEPALEPVFDDFVKQHVLSWMPEYGKAVNRLADTPYCQWMGLALVATMEFLAREQG